MTDRFEYKTVDYSSSNIPMLNELGAEGWEMVGVQNAPLPGMGPKDAVRLYFKRRLPSSPQED